MSNCLHIQLIIMIIILVKSKHTLTAPAILNGLDPQTGSQTGMHDLNYAIPMVSLNYFKSSLLPPLREGLYVNDIVTRLTERGHIGATGRWTRLPGTLGEAKDFEHVVFKDFLRIATAVSETAQTALQEFAKAQLANKPTAIVDVRPTALFHCNPDMTTSLKYSSSTYKPDSYARLNPQTPFALPGRLTENILWDEIVVPGEFKKHATRTDINDVSSQYTIQRKITVDITTRTIAS